MTFQREQRGGAKEQFEWIHSWCDYADRKDKPRVLLIGDSITYGYQAFVRENLGKVAYVDYIATSYCPESRVYRGAVLGMAQDSEYAVIHYNFGLHGIHLSAEDYEADVRAFVGELQKFGKVVLANTTDYLDPDLNAPLGVWGRKVEERNRAAEKIARERGLELDDLYALCRSFPIGDRLPDGVHYEESGYRKFAARVAEVCEKYL